MNFKEFLKEKSQEGGLKKAVISDIVGMNKGEAINYLKDVCQYGGVSGIMSGLIYYTDTIAFYDMHQEEIENLVYELQNQEGYTNRFEFLASLNGAENVSNLDQEKNLLAWLSYEETARIILEELDPNY